MRRDHDHTVRDRRNVVIALLTRLPDGVEIELLGRLPTTLEEELRPFGGYRVPLTNDSRAKLSNVLVDREPQIIRHLVGLIARSGPTTLFEGYHLFDHGSANDSGTAVFVHEEFPPTILQELENSGALVIEGVHDEG